MRAGRWDEAWAIEARVLAARDPSTRDDPRLPYHQRWVWDARAFDGRDTLVRCYHGLGDAIQFARFLPALAARAASVTVEAPAALHPLLAQLDERLVLAAFDQAHPLPPSACDIEMSELPLALRLAPSACAVPYLAATATTLPAGTVAICYGTGGWDPGRDIPAALLAPIVAGRPAVTLMPEPTGLPVLNPAGCPMDMMDTAALIAGSALVVTVDTMVAHLAGALGRPTHLLLKAEPDWRWNPQARTSAWYPSIRQRVQPRPGDWAGVVDEVLAAL